MNGIEGGRYFPYIYGMLYGIGTFLYLGKSVTSSGWGYFVDDEGFNICGGWINGSFKWAYP
jgi:hypothetical protein